jgi:hypothetical protein
VSKLDVGKLCIVVRPHTPAFLGAVGTVLQIGPHHWRGIKSEKAYPGVEIEFPRDMPWRHGGKNMRVGWMRASRVAPLDDQPGQDETLVWKQLPVPPSVFELDGPRGPVREPVKERQ